MLFPVARQVEGLQDRSLQVAVVHPFASAQERYDIIRKIRAHLTIRTLIMKLFVSTLLLSALPICSVAKKYHDKPLKAPGKVQAAYNMVDADAILSKAVKKYSEGGVDAVKQIPCVDADESRYIFCGEISSDGKRRLETLNIDPNFQGRSDKIKDSPSTSRIMDALNDCEGRKTGDSVLATYPINGKTKTAIIMDGKYKKTYFYCGYGVWVEEE